MPENTSPALGGMYGSSASSLVAFSEAEEKISWATAMRAKPAVSVSKMRIRTDKLFRIRLSCSAESRKGPQSYRRKAEFFLLGFEGKDGRLIGRWWEKELNLDHAL